MKAHSDSLTAPFRSWFVRAALLYYSAYVILSAFVEPFTWFGNDRTSRIGWRGHLLLLLSPAIPAAVVLLSRWRRARASASLLGVVHVSSGDHRVDAFQALRDRATKRIIIVGVAMNAIVSYDLSSISRQAVRVPVDFLMLDPDLLRDDPALAKHLTEFFDIPAFPERLRSSFERLQHFCNDWNTHEDHRHRMSLKVYRTIPTNSMTIIDPDDDTGEALVEFFLYQSGAYRPRFLVHRIDHPQSLFARIVGEYRKLWDTSRRIV